ncbi:HAMP domain-containing protein [Clostridiaceae bacterium UIB06]|uniref:histidine kinase n=1 Tax=Clostridium thailandense TaxID=2794346 RepID=A0A949U422_9CLOT|nr:ATP-binding protein [Clostridium thailandense]MBV7276029.1 HAMP domain-containing protein [Clostridium thailandense]MCH5137012.1 HAMP domain-containing protein [Clostridiaceae bacterium UIB06]
MKNKILVVKKISLKLTLVYAFVFSLVIITLNGSVLYGVRYFLTKQAVRQVSDTSRYISTRIEELERKNVNLKNEDLLQEINPREAVYVKITDSEGKMISISPRWNKDFSFQNSSEKVLKIEKQEKHLVYKSNSIKINNKLFVLTVVKDMEYEYHFLKLLLIMVAISNVLGIIIAVLSGMFVSKKMLTPIDKITKTAQSVSIQGLNKRIEVNAADDELSRLARTFNEMIERLQKSFESQNKFVSDASHELRTPISVIQGYINLLDRWGKEDKEVLQKAINIIKNETANMTNLIEKLLFLARGDNNSLKLEKEIFDLNTLIDEVVKESSVIAPKLNIASERNDKIIIYADFRLIKQALRALVDNSIKYTQEEGEIKINSYRRLGEAEITIEDSGIGISEEEIPNLFNRFYRVDKARSKKTGGSGLGLAIVKHIIDRHCGKICIESDFGKGTKVTINLPAKV